MLAEGRHKAAHNHLIQQVEVLVAALKRAAQSGGRLKLANPSARVREVLQIAGLLSLFEMYEDQVLAVGSF